MFLLNTRSTIAGQLKPSPTKPITVPQLSPQLQTEKNLNKVENNQELAERTQTKTILSGKMFNTLGGFLNIGAIHDVQNATSIAVLEIR